MPINAHKLSVKLFLVSAANLESIVPVFHSWIQMQAVANHLLVDVADYSHVADGPGVVLVAREANFYFDTFGGEPGLTYQRKQPVAGSFRDRLQQALAEAASAAERLEQDPTLDGSVKFRTDTLSLRIADRLLAANDEATWQALLPELSAAVAELLGPQATITHAGAGRDLFEVRISAPAGGGLGVFHATA